MRATTLKTITQTLLLAVVAVVPFIYTGSLYFPYVSGKVYIFRFLVALALFFWIWMVLKRTENREQRTKLLFKNVLVVALLMFFLAQAFVSFFGVNLFQSFFSNIERADGVFQYGFWVLYFLMLASTFREERDWKKFFFVFIAAAFVLSLYSWFKQFSDFQFEGIFGNPAYFAAFLLFAIGFSLVAFERRFLLGKLRYLFLISAGFLMLTLVFTYIRGSYVGFAGGAFLFCVLSFLFLRHDNKKLANWCGIILLAGIISVSALFVGRDTDLVKSSRLLSRVTEVVEIWQVPSVKERLLNWNIALKAFKERPLFGWGPENYDVAANKYYDFRVGQNEPWFDRAHSQPFDVLATGGVVLFLFYLFWILSAFFLIWRISKNQKILSFILASVFSAYLLQGFFLFDTLAVSLGLFPFLAYLVYLNPKPQIPNPKSQIPNYKLQTPILFVAAVFSLFLIYTTVIVPWRANNAAWHFFNLTENGLYIETKPYLEKAFSIRSPYTYWETRKLASWQFRTVLEYRINAETPSEQVTQVQELYDFLVPEFERHVAARPTYPQMYETLSVIYRFGFEKLGRGEVELEKAQALLKEAFKYSDLRIEYFREMAKVMMLQGKIKEVEQIIKGHAQRMPPEWGLDVPFITLGNFYFEAEKYGQALEQYDKAIEVGFQIQKNAAVYPRYMLTAEAQGDYQRIVDMGQKYLEHKGPDTDTYFNIAVGYWHLNKKEKAKEFFLKAVELKPEEHEQYREFFVE